MLFRFVIVYIFLAKNKDCNRLEKRLALVMEINTRRGSVCVLDKQRKSKALLAYSINQKVDWLVQFKFV